MATESQQKFIESITKPPLSKLDIAVAEKRTQDVAMSSYITLPPRPGGSGATSGAEKVARVIAAEKARMAIEQEALRGQQLIEKMREQGRLRLEQRKQSQAKSAKLIGALGAREQLSMAAKARGRPFSQTEAQRFLKQRGVSISELREATRASRKHFKKTGVSVQRQIRDEVKLVEQGRQYRPTREDLKSKPISVYFDGSRVKGVKETYSPKMKGYISESPTGFQGSVYMRPPTPTEKYKIEKAQQIGSLGIFKKPETYTTPEGVKSIFDFGAELTLRAGEFIGEKTRPVMEFLEGDIGLRQQLEKKPIKRETAKSLISTAYMFAAFEPLMRTGTAQVQVQESKYIYDYQKGRYVTKAQVKDYLKDPKVTQTGKKIIIKDLKFSDKASRINELLRRATTGEQRTEIIKLAQETYGKEFVKEFVSQELGVVPTTIKSTDNLFLSRTSGVELKGISAIETSVSLQPSRVGETQWIKKSVMDVKQDQLIKQDTKTKQLFLQGLDTKTRQRTRQDTKQDVKQDTKQDTLLKSLLALKQIPKQIQKPKIPEPTTPTTWQPTPPRKPEPPIPPPVILPKTGLVKRLAKKVDEGDLFEIFTTKGGEDILIGKEKTQLAAEKLLKGKLVGTLRAGGFLKKSGKKIKVTQLMTFGGEEFRPSKIDPYKIIEKKQKRLRKRTTGKEVQMFRTKGRRKNNSFGF